MVNFIHKNIKWLLSYFEKVKWLFDMLALFFVFETFIYSVDLKNSVEFGSLEVSALKVVFWILIFIINLLLYIKTDMEYTQEDDYIGNSIFRGAALSKFILRIIIFILLSVNTVLLFREMKIAIHNSYFSILWIGLGMIVFFEITRTLFNYYKPIRKNKNG